MYTDKELWYMIGYGAGRRYIEQLLVTGFDETYNELHYEPTEGNLIDADYDAEYDAYSDGYIAFRIENRLPLYEA